MKELQEKRGFLKKLMGFLKNFFRLRRTGHQRRRNTGYYWVVWSYASNDNYMKIGFYNAANETWKLPGTDRTFYDSSFIHIVERQVDPFPWATFAKGLVIAALVCTLYSIAHLVITLPEFLKLINNLTK